MGTNYEKPESLPDETHRPLPAFVLPVGACQQKPAETVEMGKPAPVALVPIPSTPVSQAPLLAQQFSPIISGYWISSRYLDEVQRTRSPKAAIQDFPNYPVIMRIEPAPAAADSTHAGLVLNLHEGGDMTVLFRPGTSATSLPARTSLGENATSYELAYQILATDTVLYFVKRNQQNQRELSRFAYRRVARVRASKNPVEQLNSEVAHTLNRLLVAGTYTGTDSLGRQLRVQFLPNGQVRGLPFRKYHVLEDFIGPAIGDEIIFNMDKNGDEGFAADFGRDTLRLYSIHSAIETPAGSTQPDSVLVFYRGLLRYQLIRQR